MKVGIYKNVHGDQIIRAHLKREFPNATIEIKYFDHEYCHIVCAATTMPFSQAVVLSIDGWGEKYFSRAFTYKDDMLQAYASSKTDSPITVSATKKIPYSMGSIYEYFTELLGFEPLADEGKVEALAAYGKPVQTMLDAMLSATHASNGEIIFDQEKLGKAINVDLFNSQVQKSGKEALAATIQTYLEKVMEIYVGNLVKRTGIRDLALAGGVAANVINNLSLYEKVADNLHITPAMADDGAAQGAAYAYLLDQGWKISDLRAITSEVPYFSTSYTRAEVKEFLGTHGASLHVQDLGDAWPEQTADLLVSGKIGAIFHGHMEWGPRALGNRSIIADARRKDFRDKINKEIKRRPLFQPFCPSMLAEEKDRLFEKAYLNKHMTCAFRLKKEYWDLLPSAMHIDGTARVQFVEEKDNPSYFRLLKQIKARTGYGVVINTSFNKHGRTIVESPKDAIDDFLATDMDYLVIEGFLVTRAIS